MKEFIDASVFLGVNSKDEKIRIACKSFFVKRLDKTIWMCLEQVGICDDTVWHFTREEQDAYYPYMDNLHTIMDIRRIPYNEKDLKAGNKIKKIGLTEKLALSMAISRKGVLYTVDRKILSLKMKCTKTPEFSEELEFPPELEKLYKNSLKLRI